MILSANIGCITHLQSGTGTPVRHWVEVLDEALRTACCCQASRDCAPWATRRAVGSLRSIGGPDAVGVGVVHFTPKMRSLIAKMTEMVKLKHSLT